MDRTRKIILSDITQTQKDNMLYICLYVDINSLINDNQVTSLNPEVKYR